MKPAAAGGPYRVPPEPSRWPAMALAAAVHAGLLLFLWIGISWQNTAPVAVEAEVWDMKTQSAAPPPPPPPAVEPESEPVPVPKVAPPPVEKVAPQAPDIALEREKKRKVDQLKQQRAEEERQQQIAEERREQKERELAEQKAREQAEKKLAEKAAADKIKADKLAKAKAAAIEQARLAKAHDLEMKRLTAEAGAGVSGTAPKATGRRLDSGYIASITSKIKSATIYLGSTDLPNNPQAVYRIEELPTGDIISVKMIKSSGVPGFDSAVEKGIIKSSPLPKKKDGTVERTLEIAFSMKDLD